MRQIGLVYGGLTAKSKANFTDGNTPFTTHKSVFRNLAVDTALNAFVMVGLNERLAAVTYGDILFTTSSESREEVGTASAVTVESTEPTHLKTFCVGFRPNSTEELNPEFAKHLFRAHVMRDEIVKTANDVTHISISKVAITKTAVPLPAVGYHKRIADILDEFDALVNDLSLGLPAEIASLGQQHAYYRDELVTFEEAVA